MFEITLYNGITESKKASVQSFHGALCKDELVAGELKVTPTTAAGDNPCGIMFKADQNGRSLLTTCVDGETIEADELVAIQKGGFEFVTDKVTGLLAIGDEVEPDSVVPGNLAVLAGGTAFGVVRDVNVVGGVVVYARIYFYEDRASKR